MFEHWGIYMDLPAVEDVTKQAKSMKIRGKPG
jgi:hypothetical protein